VPPSFPRPYNKTAPTALFTVNRQLNVEKERYNSSIPPCR
jgi:hypothetical protein